MPHCGLKDRKPMNIRRESLEGGGVVHLIFDRPGSTANLFDRATLLELNQHIREIADNTRAEGLVFSSAKPSIFISGADIKELFTADVSEAEVLEVVALGQDVFSSIDALTIPSVAAIHGASMGGGFEIALACDYRVASGDKVTKIGLPETQLGILPAWGGCTRLPRVIGLPAALDIILTGKSVAAHKARRLGMVDEVVARERLLGAALHQIGKGKVEPRTFGLKHSGPARKLVA